MNKRRVVYTAWGWFADEAVTQQRFRQFEAFHEFLEHPPEAWKLEDYFGKDCAPETLAAMIEVRRFESKVGAFCGMQPHLGWKIKNREGALVLQNSGGKLFIGRFQKEATKVGKALEALLSRLGAKDVASSQLDG
jgi:hypothetical protein